MGLFQEIGRILLPKRLSPTNFAKDAFTLLFWHRDKYVSIHNKFFIIIHDGIGIFKIR